MAIEKVDKCKFMYIIIGPGIHIMYIIIGPDIHIMLAIIHVNIQSLERKQWFVFVGFRDFVKMYSQNLIYISHLQVYIV